MKRVMGVLGAVVTLGGTVVLRFLGWVTLPDDLRTLRALGEKMLGPLSLPEFALLFFGAICIAIGLGWNPRAPEERPLGPRERMDRLHNLVKLQEALAYWHFREWNHHLDGVDRFIHYGSAATNLEALAGNGVLEIWGRSGNDPGIYAKPIPADAWDEQVIDRSSIHTEIPHTVYREVSPGHKYGTFFDLGVNWKEIEELFPPKRFRTIRAWLRRGRAALTAS